MLILKVGGGRSINLEGIVCDLAGLKQRCIIVHGANAARDELAEKLAKPRRVLTSVSGFTSVYSDRDALDILMMAYAGLANKRLVELCQMKGINAVGLSGLDGRVIQGKRNSGIRVREGDRVRLVHDQSGKSRTVNRPLLDWLLDSGYTPVLSVPIAGEGGEALNSENDDIVHTLQKTYRAAQVIHLIEAPGLLDDPADEDSLIRSLTRDQLHARCERSEGRIKRKLYAIEKLLDGGPVEVMIADGRALHPLKRALEGEGTVIRA